MTTLFIGVVSHEGTRFADSHGPDGLAAALARELVPRGIDTTVVVNTTDEHDPIALPIDGALGWASVREQLALEGEWDRYLAQAPGMPARSRMRDKAVHALRLGRAWARYWRPWHRSSDTSAPEIRLVRRLVNIELSHLRLMREALAMGADWVLIVEDDAAAEDVRECAAGLAMLIGTASAADQPAYANVSRSFGHDELRIAPMLSPVPALTWPGERVVLASSRPVSDTVCAVLYRRSFLIELVQVLASLPMTPVVPIDWKLNRALMVMHGNGALGAGDCWLVEPGPIVQRSMG